MVICAAHTVTMFARDADMTRRARECRQCDRSGPIGSWFNRSGLGTGGEGDESIPPEREGPPGQPLSPPEHLADQGAERARSGGSGRVGSRYTPSHGGSGRVVTWRVDRSDRPAPRVPKPVSTTRLYSFAVSEVTQCDGAACAACLRHHIDGRSRHYLNRRPLLHPL